VLKHFTGSATHKVDGKGRVSLPAEFRKVLEAVGSGHVVLLPQMNRSDAHAGLSQLGYEALLDRIERMDVSHEEREAASYRFMHNARAIPVDDAGRIVLSKDLRDMIGIGSEVLFTGDGSFFQLWEPGRYALFASRLREPSLELARRVSLGGLHG
jgi:MraZ protein